jgi:hypothetical protein
MGTYNLTWHVLSHTKGLVPCNTLCSSVKWLGSDPDATLVGALDDALKALAGSGTLADTYGAKGFGTTDQSKWGWVPTVNQSWGDLDAVANAGIGLGLIPQPNLGARPTQNRSTWMQAITLDKKGISGLDVLVPGESGFISKTGTPSPHFNDQVSLVQQLRVQAHGGSRRLNRAPREPDPSGPPRGPRAVTTMAGPRRPGHCSDPPLHGETVRFWC